MAVGGAQGDDGAAEEEEEVGAADGAGGGQAEILADDGEDEVGVAFGEVVLLLHPSAEADAGEAAVAEGHLGLEGLVVLAGGLVAEAGHAVLVGGHDGAEEECAEEGQRAPSPPVGPAGQEERAGEAGHHHQPAEVGLEQEGHAHGAEEGQRHEEAFLPTPHQRPDPPEVGGEEDDHHELDELDRLDVDGAQPDPTVGAFDGLAQPGHEDQEQPHHHRGGQRPEHPLLPEEAVVQEVERRAGDDAAAEEDELHLQEVEGILGGGLGLAGVGDHQHAEGRQGQRQGRHHPHAHPQHRRLLLPP